MSDDRAWSSTALTVCLICDAVWALATIGACTYIVFWMNQSGAWYVLAIFLATAWSCKQYRSPAQIATDPESRAAPAGSEE